ncbi:LAETG motif-containing sortase-dependent surface protein [Streptomyces sp. NPDC052043]|uniref:LAETG motif-containing sortase-dependent surface protein n=1 Tax=Streptomyces sp. NPDC052043 TaxID=3365684 RepID=UPI0037D04E11
MRSLATCDADTRTTTDPVAPASADPAASPAPDPAVRSAGDTAAADRTVRAADEPNRPRADGGPVNLAETGGDGRTPYLAVGGAAALALGSAALFAAARRRAAAGGGRGRTRPVERGARPVAQDGQAPRHVS